MIKIKYIAIISILLNIYFLVRSQYTELTDFSYESSDYEYFLEYPPPKTPTVFVFERTSESDLYMRHEVEKAILTVADKLLFSNEPQNYIENYIIIDEGDYWYVYCGARGNGFLESKSNQRSNLNQSNIRSVYLDKKTLRPVIPRGNYIKSFVWVDVPEKHNPIIRDDKGWIKNPNQNMEPMLKTPAE